MPKFLKDYLSFWTRALDSNSEASRSEYVTGIVGNTVLWVILRLITPASKTQGVVRFVSGEGILGLVLMLITVAMVVPIITLSMRRLNALGKNPFLGLLSAIPILGYVFFGYIAMMKDSTSTNSEGDDAYVPISGYAETTIDELADVATVPPKVKSRKAPGDIVKVLGQKLGFIRKDQLGDAKILADEGHAVNVEKAPSFVKTAPPEVKRKGLGYKLISKNEKIWLKELRYTGAEQDSFAKNRLHFVILSIVVAIVGYKFGGQASTGIAGIAIAFGVFVVLERRARLKREYANYNFEKQVEFSKFMRTVVPYLMNQSDYSFYEVLNKITHRMRIEAEFKPLENGLAFGEDDKGKGVIIEDAEAQKAASDRLFDLEEVENANPVPIEEVEDVPVIAPTIKLQEEDVI